MKQQIQKLGTFSFHQNVEPFTKYLVINTKNKDQEEEEKFNKICAMAYGCMIVSDKWVSMNTEQKLIK